MHFLLRASVVLCILLFVGERKLVFADVENEISFFSSGVSINGPLTLRKAGPQYTGEFRIRNATSHTIAISRIALREDREDGRAPLKVTVQLADGRTSCSLSPKEGKSVSVKWEVDVEDRARQFFGYVVVTSDERSVGEVAMGVRAQQSVQLPFLNEHLVSWLILVPCFGAGLILFFRAIGFGSFGAARRTALVAAGSEFVLVLWTLQRFDTAILRADGNDGYQFIERAVWIRPLGVEYFVGVDGISLGMLFLVGLIGLVAMVATPTNTPNETAYYSVYLLLLSTAAGLFTALDGMLFFAFWSCAILFVFLLIGLARRETKSGSAPKFLVCASVGTAFLFGSFLLLHNYSGGTFLGDGTAVGHTFAFPEWARSDFGVMRIGGATVGHIAWFMLFLAFATVMPLFPFHTWLPSVFVETSPAASVAIVALIEGVGAFGLLRFNVGMLPGETRAMSGFLVGVGAVNVLYGTLCALSPNDLRSFAAYGSVAHMGFCVLGAGALVSQGIAACVLEIQSHAIVTSLFLLLLGALYRRVQTCDARELGGLAEETPNFAFFLGISVLAFLGLPGLSGFWGQAFAIVGIFPTHWSIAMLILFAVIVLTVYPLRVLGRVLFGPFKSAWRKHPLLEPFAGRIPDLDVLEVATIMPLVLLCALLGFWPSPFLSIAAGAVRDASTALVANPLDVAGESSEIPK